MKIIAVEIATDAERRKRTMTDLISRQAAIDICEKISGNRYLSADGNLGAEMCAERIAQLPPAQPEIIRCKDCRHDSDCDIQYHAQAGGMFYCALAERKTDE